MKPRMMLIAAPLALFASQATAENWVTVTTYSGGDVDAVDKDSIHRESDGLVYYSDKTAYERSTLAVECNRRLLYVVKVNGTDRHDWRDHGVAADVGVWQAAELKFVCANVR